jgi:hypothetical protein
MRRARMYMYCCQENKTGTYVHVLLPGKWDRHLCTCIAARKMRQARKYMYCCQENETDTHVHVLVQGKWDRIVFTCIAARKMRQQGRIQDFKLGGGALKLNCAERREARKFWGYFVWKITILRQKILFFPIAEGGAKIFGVFRLKNHDFVPKNHIFSNFRGARTGCAPFPGSAPGQDSIYMYCCQENETG